MAEKSENRSRSEDVLGETWDRCIADTAIKIVSGIGIGIVSSAVLFKRRPWPLAFGAAVGLGMGYSNCQNELKKQYCKNKKSDKCNSKSKCKKKTEKAADVVAMEKPTVVTVEKPCCEGSK
ncbi:MICOS complex subunit Mic10-like [Tubulanus polymorphus]|uniref:MICOS complex subunit Mic10-like n=1 Tax=Tubulanus polymorphus TaxID=672921 RepID=UPI003DA48D47